MLSCDALPQPTGTAESTLTSKLTIERIVILGLPLDKSYTARAGSKSFEVLSGVGVDLRLAKGSAVVVRAVNLPIASDWSLRITERVAAE